MTPVVEVGSPDSDANAFSAATELAIQAPQKGNYSSPTLAVPAVGNLTGIQEYLSESLARQLEREGAAKWSGLLLHLVTQRRYPPRDPGPLVVVTTVRQLTQFIHDQCVTHSIVAPWGEDDVEHVP